MPRCCLPAYAVILLAAVLPARIVTAAPLEFNRDIRPILSENCYHCHGQDAAHREGKLRLDEFESATRDRDGYAVIAPGKPDDSELILRLISTDDEERMPPPNSNKHVTPAQIQTLRQWIAEGAVYQKHWAFTVPQHAALPSARQESWARHPLDRFVLAPLEREGLSPSPEATPEMWLRRASFDLTGLPPTPAELDGFAADVARRAEPAYGAAVDRLLASPHFGERLAIDWLDAARYADSHGFNNDSTRTMWRWRDWVIEAFNANLPYDRFITEQLAGDLLPQPTLNQRIATGFGRNHVINSEGGIIEEEYRVEYVADRVRTLSTAWLGLTMECARCHDHKFDPIPQRDYYRLFAFFNNVPELGEDGRVANAIPLIPAPTDAQQASLATQEKNLATLHAALQGPRKSWRWRKSLRPEVEAITAAARTAIGSDAGVDLLPPRDPAAPVGVIGPAWRPSPLAKAGTTSAPIAVPGAGAAPAPTPAPAPAPAPASAAAPTLALASAPTPSPAAGTPAPASAPAAPTPTPGPKITGEQLDFAGKEGVTLSFWLRPDADNPADVALLSALNHVGSKADSQYGRGREIRLINGEVELRLSERLPMYAIIVRSKGAAIRPETWRHVTVTYAGGKVAAAVRIFVDGTEMATEALYNGLPGEPPKREFLIGADNSPEGMHWRGAFDGMRSFPRALDGAAVRARFHAEALPVALRMLERTPRDPLATTWVREALLAERKDTRVAHAERTALWETHLALHRSLPTAMVMQELPQPRPAFVLNRGNYDAHGEPVEAGVPEALIAPWPAGAPRNRLGLAQWLTQPTHPLTSRVVVNRFWAQLFGTGLVKTLEDFGSQSEWPSHPELLDWLSRDFVDGGWNVKALLRSLVLSATYRQTSSATPALIARDPENRLLARGPRLRLPAELLRDQALAVSGLLTRQLGGPSVFPYQPEKLYAGLVVGANYPGTTWTQSTGDDLYRRSLYTFWKRTVPHPAMLTFDAPDREVCVVRRSRTNTPLQALALWNEPGYVEAARHLGARLLREGGASDSDRVAFAFRLATGRRPDSAEARVLTEALGRLRDDFSAHPDDARALIAVGASPVDSSFPPADLAAATSVASMILSLDETLTKN